MLQLATLHGQSYQGGQAAVVGVVAFAPMRLAHHPISLPDGSPGYRGSDPDVASMVLLGVELIGGEIADTRFSIRRRIHADDPADLGAPLSYAVEVLADDDQELDPAAAVLSKSRHWVLAALRADGDLQTVKQLGDRLAQAGHPLKPRTIQTALGELEAVGLAQGTEEGNGRARYWSPVILEADSGHDQAGDGGGQGTP